MCLKNTLKKEKIGFLKSCVGATWNWRGAQSNCLVENYKM